MEKSILRYLLMMGVIAAPIKANNIALVVPQPLEQLLEEGFRFLLTISKLLFILIGLTILGISMMPTVAMVLNIDMSIFGIIAGGLAPILSMTITSILASSFSGAISSIAYPAQTAVWIRCKYQ